MESVLVAFSGGVDSALVLKVAHEELGSRAVAFTAISPTFPPEEQEQAQKFSKELGVEHLLVDSYEIEQLFGTGSTASTDARYAITSMPSEGNTGNVTYKEVTLETDTNYQYSGKPIIFQLDAWASHSGDYKGDSYQNGEVVMRYFPVLDIEQVDNQGIYIEALYKTDGNWTKCKSSDMVIDSAGIQYEDINGSNKSQIWGDLNDTYPVELTWNAKQGLPNFDGNITMRVRIKYGTAAFDTNSTSGSGGS